MIDFTELTDEQKLEAAQIIHDCYIKAPYSYDWDVKNILKYFTKMIKKGYIVGTIAQDEHIVGVCIFTFTTPEGLINLGIMKSQELNAPEAFCYIQDICVSPGHQHMGIGKKMLSEFMGPIVLFTYIDADAVTFYEHLGFKSTKSQTIKNRLYFVKR